jgi:membrane protease YdiL (CAAX protease family)
LSGPSPEGSGDPTPAADTVTSVPAADEGSPSTRQPPGAAIFSLDGRAAPGLYLVGWLATVLGLAVLAAVVLSGPGGTGGLVLALISSGLLAVGLVAAAGAQGIDRRARGAMYAGPSPFLVFAASLPIALPGAVLALRVAELAGVDPSSPLGSLIGQVILLVGLALLVRLLVVGPGALGWSEMGLPLPRVNVALGHLASGAVLAVPVILMTAVVSGLLVTALGTRPDSPLPVTHDGTGIALNFLAAVIVAPLGEELFFRGFALTAWDRSLGQRRALIRAALFFAFIHVLTVGGATFGEAASRAVIGFTTRLPVAFVLGWLFLRRRSILAPIGLHATFNGLLLLVAQAAGS